MFGNPTLVMMEFHPSFFHVSNDIVKFWNEAKNKLDNI